MLNYLLKSQMKFIKYSDNLVKFTTLEYSIIHRFSSIFKSMNYGVKFFVKVCLKDRINKVFMI
jgi:hypothetical protein